jgi:hypothetical protein
VLQFKTSKIINDMAKVQIKSEKITPFGGIFHVRVLFSRFVGPVIDCQPHQEIGKKTVNTFRKTPILYHCTIVPFGFSNIDFVP